MASNGTFYEKSDTACLLNVFHINQPINFEIYINPLTALHSQINVWKPDIFSRMCMQITLYEFLNKSLWQKRTNTSYSGVYKICSVCGILLIKKSEPIVFLLIAVKTTTSTTTEAVTSTQAKTTTTTTPRGMVLATTLQCSRGSTQKNLWRPPSYRHREKNPESFPAVCFEISNQEL